MIFIVILELAYTELPPTRFPVTFTVPELIIANPSPPCVFPFNVRVVPEKKIDAKDVLNVVLPTGITSLA